jgi:two-component system invasion response regulator UvrY
MSDGSTGAVTATRFVSIDDHPVISDAIGQAAAAYDDLEMVGTFASLEAVPKPLRSPDRFDVALLDLRLPGLAGTPAVANVVEWGVQVLVYSAAATTRQAEQVFLAGAAGFVSKSAPTLQVLDAIRAVSRGERVSVGLVSPGGSLADLSPADHRLLGALTDKSRSKDLARELGLSPRTIDNMITQLYWKLGLEQSQRSRASLREWAQQNGYEAATSD